MTNSNWKPVAHNPVCLEDDLRYSQCVCDGTRWHGYGERVGDFAGVWALTGWMAGLSEQKPVAHGHGNDYISNRNVGEFMWYLASFVEPSEGALAAQVKEKAEAMSKALLAATVQPAAAPTQEQQFYCAACRYIGFTTVELEAHGGTCFNCNDGDHIYEFKTWPPHILPKGPANNAAAQPVAVPDWVNDAASVIAQFIHLSAIPDHIEWAKVAIDGVRLLNTRLAARQPSAPVEREVAVPDGCDPEFMAALARGDHLNGLGDPATVARAVAIARQFPFKGEGATRQPSAQVPDDVARDALSAFLAECSVSQDIDGIDYIELQVDRGVYQSAMLATRQPSAQAEDGGRDAERLDWLDSQRQDMVERDHRGDPELIGHSWYVDGQCNTVREAIDAAMLAASKGGAE